MVFARTLADSAQWSKALQLLSALQRQELWLEASLFGSTIHPIIKIKVSTSPLG